MNDKKDADVKCPQSMKCIICNNNLVLFFNFKTQAKKGLIIHNTTNGIITLKNHVNADHSIIVKIFEEELNSPLKGKVEKQLAKKNQKNQTKHLYVLLTSLVEFKSTTMSFDLWM